MDDFRPGQRGKGIPRDRYLSAARDRREQIAAMLRRGMRNQAIADALGISMALVKYHASKLYAQAGVSSCREWLANLR